MADSKLPTDVAARHAAWRQLGWEEIPDSELDVVWERFERAFGFFGTGIREPAPSLTWDITLAFQRDDAFLARIKANLNLKMLRVLQHCINPGERVIALDWMHSCFWFDPCGGVTTGDADDWAIPVLPVGDHYVFLASDLRFGTIGHLETSVCVFGRELLDAFAVDPPEAFTHLVRKDGQLT